MSTPDKPWGQRSTRVCLTAQQYKQLRRKGYVYFMVGGVSFNLRIIPENPLQQKIAELSKQIRELRASAQHGGDNGGVVAHRRQMSLEARAKISAGRKAWWAKQREATPVFRSHNMNT
jgi:hypothetical protein